MLFYRLKQFHRALFPRVEFNEYRWIQEILPHGLFQLFTKQSLADQRHALDVCQELQEQESALIRIYDLASYQDLLASALLHDIGKSIFPPLLWQRVYIVLVKKLTKTHQISLQKHKNIFGKTLRLDTNHPRWGKHLVAKAGGNRSIQFLILVHHSPQTALARILSAADSKH